MYCTVYIVHPVKVVSLSWLYTSQCRACRHDQTCSYTVIGSVHCVHCTLYTVLLQNSIYVQYCSLLKCRLESAAKMWSQDLAVLVWYTSGYHCTYLQFTNFTLLTVYSQHQALSVGRTSKVWSTIKHTYVAGYVIIPEVFIRKGEGSYLINDLPENYEWRKASSLYN